MSGKKLLVLLAAGFSRRFGPENKLLYELDGLPLYRHTLDKLAALRDEETDVLVMTNTPEIQAYCTENGLCWSPSPEAAEGIAATVRAAVEQAETKRASACVFFVADQPKLKLSTMRGFLRFCTEQGAALACVKAPAGREIRSGSESGILVRFPLSGGTSAVGRFWHNTQKKCSFIRQNRQK